uniref:FGE-sulfatase domain-containing protein n=1 Tax=Panagrellus redivivus TaxID=6233 RepID=A0A7E4VAZ8_PANRE
MSRPSHKGPVASDVKTTPDCGAKSGKMEYEFIVEPGIFRMSRSSPAKGSVDETVFQGLCLWPQGQGVQVM